MSNLLKRVGNNPLSKVQRYHDDWMTSMNEYFDKTFGDIFNPDVFEDIKVLSGYPKMDIKVEDGNWVVRAAVPGMVKENITIEESDGVITIKGEKNESWKQDGEWQIRELHSSRFSRSFNLPSDVIGEPEAVLKDGVLTLKWKIDEKAKDKVEVKTIECKEE